MAWRRIGGLALACLVGSGASGGAAPAIDLQLVIDGLRQPVFVADAGDGSGRLFVVEQDGRILILNRHFGWLSGLSATLVVADISGLGAGGIIEPRTIATLAPPLTVDNMEALSLGCADGRTIVYLASDDNLMPIQRSLLLEFELAPPFAGPCR